VAHPVGTLAHLAAVARNATAGTDFVLDEPVVPRSGKLIQTAARSTHAGTCSLGAGIRVGPMRVQPANSTTIEGHDDQGVQTNTGDDDLGCSSDSSGGGDGVGHTITR
jgi:hypothetical protein